MSERKPAVDRLRRAYAFLRGEGHFVTVDACLAGISEINRLRSVLARFVTSFEGVDTHLTDEQETAYEATATESRSA